MTVPKTHARPQGPGKSLLALACMSLTAVALTAQPTNNPVAAHYGDGGYPGWIDAIAWDNVVDVTADTALTTKAVANDDTKGAQNFAAFEEARDLLYAEGGGVLYFPAGTYYFELPDAGYGPGIGPMSRGLMLKEGIVIRGAEPGSEQAVVRDQSNQLIVTYDLEPTTVFQFPFVKRGVVPANASGVDGEPAGTADAAGEVPTHWNFIGITEGTNEAGLDEVNNVGVVNVELNGGTIVFGFESEWATHMGATGAKWEGNMFKVDWPEGSAATNEDWINRVPNGEHYMDLINGRSGWDKFVAAGSGRLVMNVKIVDGAPWNDMIYTDRKTAEKTTADKKDFIHYRFAGRIIAYGSDIFVANNVLAKPTRNFVHVQTQNTGEETILFDYANHLGVDVNKSLYGGNQNHASVLDPGTGYNYENVVVQDNWVFNRGNKGFEVSGQFVVMKNNHNERYHAANVFPIDYIANPDAYPSATEATGINAGGISFDGWRWQSSESSDDYLARGYDFGGRYQWVHGNTVINTGSRGNDGEGLLIQRHNNIETYSWAWTYNENGRRNLGPGTIGENGYIGSYDVHHWGFLLLNNKSTGSVGFLKPASNRFLDMSLVGGNAGAGGVETLCPASGPCDVNLSDHTDAVTAPANVALEAINASTNKITWTDASDNELGFRIDRSLDGVEWTPISYRPLINLSVTAEADGLGDTHTSLAAAELNQPVWYDYFAPASGSAQYRVVAINANDDDSTGVSEVVGEVSAAPVITEEPESAIAVEGTSVTFSVTATGADPLSYQWKKDGVDIAGATSADYTIAAAAEADEGEYTVEVTDAGGSTLSAAATLSVLALPELSATELEVNALGGTLSVDVTADASIDWTSETTAEWMSVSAGASASGSATVEITVDPTMDAASRSGVVTVAGVDVTVLQLGLAETYMPGAVAGANGSWNSEWLGTFWIEMDGPDVMIYSLEHGWWATFASLETRAMWVYDYALFDWIYVHGDLYPWLYLWSHADWARVLPRNGGPLRWFFLYQRAEWVLESEL